jgi:hypothetical protein
LLVLGAQRQVVQRVEIGRSVGHAHHHFELVHRRDPAAGRRFGRFVVGEHAVADVERLAFGAFGVQLDQAGDRKVVRHELFARLAVLATAIERAFGGDDDAGAVHAPIDVDLVARAPDGVGQAHAHLVDHQVALPVEAAQRRHQRAQLSQALGKVVVHQEFDMVGRAAGRALDHLHDDVARLSHG